MQGSLRRASQSIFPSNSHERAIIRLREEKGVPLTRNTIYSLLQAGKGIEDVEYVRQVQSLMVQSSLDSTTVLGNHLIRLFAQHGCLIEANQVLSNIKIPSKQTWAAIILANAKMGQPHLALDLYQNMQQFYVSNEYIYVATIKACTVVEGLMHGRLIHLHTFETIQQPHTVLSNSLIDMYAKSGSLGEAITEFEGLLDPDIVSWNAMIMAYSQYDCGPLALDCYKKMQEERVKPNEVTFLGLLKACNDLKSIDHGIFIHNQIIASGLRDVIVGSSLVDMYAKCGDLGNACNVFYRLQSKTVVSWNVLIAGYAQQGNNIVPLECFCRMQQQGIKPNETTFFALLKTCSSIGAVEEGRLVHEKVIRSGFLLHLSVINSLIDMYAKCGKLTEAYGVLEKLPNRDVVSWNALIVPFQHDRALLVLDWYEKMQQDGLIPDQTTLSSLLKACASIGAVERGRMIHDLIVRRGLYLEAITGSAVVDMYAKCGSLNEAHRVFKQLPKCNVVCWGAMIAAYAQHGKGTLAVEYFEKMEREGIKPNEVLFTSILIACNHAGLVAEGCMYFRCMSNQYGISPNAVHCSCMIDMLGHIGYLNEAEQLLRAHLEADVMGWTSLLSASRLHGDLGMAKRCFMQVLSLDSGCTAGYVLMSSAQAHANIGNRMACC